ncbi:MAG: TSUP family transporter [Deltaproteobacteria bacterium]|nr:TSUP family transporter [Deltaproteobacteria bacterium]
MEILLLSVAAFVAGFVDAVAGGGGVVTFPVFLFLNLPVSQIVGTNKFVSTAGTLIATLTFFKKGKISPEILRLALPFSVAGALLGAVTVLLLPNEFLKPVVSVLIIGVALYCYIRPNLGAQHSYTGLTPRSSRLVCAAAFALAAYDGFFGPGTGIFLTFFFINVLKFDFVRAAGNTKALNLISNVVPLLYFLTQGTVRFDLAIPMALANIVGGYCGAHAAIRKGNSFVKWIYVTMALLTAGKLILDACLH